MNHEQQPTSQMPNPAELTEPQTGQPTSHDPVGQVGHIYRVELPDDGSPPTVERLAAADRPRIWVGSWLDYNNGVLYGEWIDADRDPGDIWADIETMLAASPTAAQFQDAAEEWGIFDHENFGAASVSEQDSIERLAGIAKGITEHGPAFAAWASIRDDETDLDGFTDCYLGEYDSVEAYAEEFHDDVGFNRLLDEVLPDSIRSYVRLDTAAIARDMIAGGDLIAVPTGNYRVWLFEARTQ